MIDIQFYNTLNHQLEAFKSIEGETVYMYNCGPTVYDYAHIGNFRSFLFADVLRRFLELVGYDVKQVMNLTDVGHMTEDHVADGAGEDKMLLAGQRLKEAKKSGQAAIENPEDPYQAAQYFIDAFVRDSLLLNLKVAADYDGDATQTLMPKATDHVGAMQEMIQTLLDRGHAYIAEDGVVYYSVESFPDYGKLSGNSLQFLKGGAGGRINDRDQAKKKHPADFLLWKPDEKHLMKWDSPWGTGYPGWHIECSVMAKAKLGKQTIDIHTGGEDNIFPHHECEIAQSHGAHDKPFANYWMHARFLQVEGEKMSKSKGNFFTVRDILEGKVTDGRAVDPAVLRLELIKAHYRTNMNFTAKGLEDSGKAVKKIRGLRSELIAAGADPDARPNLDLPVLKDFMEALADDLNIAGALGVLFSWLSGAHDKPSESMSILNGIDHVLAVAKPSQETEVGDGLDIRQICKDIDRARADKDYGKADELRDQLMDLGYLVSNSPAGTVAEMKLA